VDIEMSTKNRARVRIVDPRQLSLFPEIQQDDPLLVYYRRLRKIGAMLSYDLEREQFFVYGVGGLPSWVVTACSNVRSRIIADLLRVEHGIEPIPEPETLAGGAVLHRLPTRHPLEHEPPVRSRAPGAPRRSNPDGAA
jgi:hypothetical protein